MVVDKSLTSVITSKTWSKSSVDSNILNTRSSSSVTWPGDNLISSRSQTKNDSLNQIKAKFYLDNVKSMTALKLSDDSMVSNGTKIIAKASDDEFALKSDHSFTNLHCSTPHKKPACDNFPNRCVMINDLNSCKLNYFGELINSETSEEDIKDNIEEHLLKRYISKTVKGWDEKGMHYWLHKVGRSNLYLPLIDEISLDSDSWYHIDICENCILQLNRCDHICCNTPSCPPKGLDKSLNETKSCGQNGDQLFDNDETVLQIDHGVGFNVQRSFNPDDEEITKTMNCNDQYFRRAVYCYNACALNFNNNSNKNIHRKANKPDSFNPIFKIVVYDGTDPCGLKFPTDLYGKESQTLLFDSCKQTRDLDILDTAKNKEHSLKNICQSTSFTTPYISNSTGVKLISLSRYNTKFNEQLDFASSGEKWETVSSSSFDFISETNVSNDFSTSTQIDSNRNSENAIIINNVCEYNSLQCTNKITKDSKEKENLWHKSLSLNNIASNGKLKLHQKLYRASRKLHKTKYVMEGKRLEIFIESEKESHRNLGAYLNKLSKKNRSPKHTLLFDKTSSMNIQMVYFGKNCNRILISDKKTEKNQNQLSNRNFGIKILYCFKFFLYFLFILFFIFSFLLIEDSLKSELKYSKINRWYKL